MSRLALKTWFLAAHGVASPSNGISGLQLQRQLGPGSDKTAWACCTRSDARVVGPDRSLLQDLVGIDGTAMPFRAKHDPADKPRGGRKKGGPKGGRSPVGKIFSVAAVELSEDGHSHRIWPHRIWPHRIWPHRIRPRRIEMAQIPDGSSKTLYGFIGRSVAAGAHVVSDGWLGHENPPANTHEVRVVAGRRAHDLLPWVHRVFSNRKRRAKGVFHGQCRAQRYLDGFVFRSNRRRPPRSTHHTRRGISRGLGPASCRDFVNQRV